MSAMDPSVIHRVEDRIGHGLEDFLAGVVIDAPAPAPAPVPPSPAELLIGVRSLLDGFALSLPGLVPGLGEDHPPHTATAREAFSHCHPPGTPIDKPHARYLLWQYWARGMRLVDAFDAWEVATRPPLDPVAEPVIAAPPDEAVGPDEAVVPLPGPPDRQRKLAGIS